MLGDKLMMKVPTCNNTLELVHYNIVFLISRGNQIFDVFLSSPFLILGEPSIDIKI